MFFKGIFTRFKPKRQEVLDKHLGTFYQNFYLGILQVSKSSKNTFKDLLTFWFKSSKNTS